ncbi:MmcQ/YjbR family DNA-binding protein [Conservatibacter flavescens]|uniref:MmcQ family protein n=1 Tax=Conservatibacter flavescens TaxID=28161 RepID=A0A2M8S3D0_9PAST|nr:MmcQ/YjbR family DNA-binding protein [Conservatibacter flavescens]PJG85607.1 hypothetical protein CVP05_05430 [Conservatibacter flavescens]
MLTEQLFQKAHMNIQKLLSFGFVSTPQGYEYSRLILAGDFRVDISISTDGKVESQVFDLMTENEYANIHIKDQQGAFVNQVREAYFSVLKEILTHCFHVDYFHSAQANRLAQSFAKQYDSRPYFPWEKHPNFAVFKHENNQKWYALIMNLDRSKLIPKSKGEVNVLNLKLNSAQIPTYLNEVGIYPAYHMNKKNWISIILDDTLSDEHILQLAEQSYQLTANKTKKTGKITEWLIPANPKYFDVEQAFSEQTELTWKQSTHIHIGDIIYMYVGAPRSAIMFKCEVLAINLPNTHKNQHVNIQKRMKIRLLQSYSPHLFPFSKLKEFQVNAVRGPRSMPSELSQYIAQTAP